MELSVNDIVNQVVIEVWDVSDLAEYSDNGYVTKTSFNRYDETKVRGKILAIERVSNNSAAIKVQYEDQLAKLTSLQIFDIIHLVKRKEQEDAQED